MIEWAMKCLLHYEFFFVQIQRLNDQKKSSTFSGEIELIRRKRKKNMKDIFYDYYYYHTTPESQSDNLCVIFATLSNGNGDNNLVPKFQCNSLLPLSLSLDLSPSRTDMYKLFIVCLFIYFFNWLNLTFNSLRNALQSAFAHI